MRLDRWLWTIAFGTCAVLAGCNHLDGFSGLFGAPRITVPAGTEIEVQLAQTVSSESARRGDEWRGVLVQPVVVEGREVIPAGSGIEGMVVSAEEPRHGNQASLQLGVRAVRVSDRKTALMADGVRVLARSSRTRSLGGITSDATTGALVGRVIADGEAPASTDLMAMSRGYQVIFQEGTPRTFVLREDVSLLAMR
jgi:hypothetical protein